MVPTTAEIRNFLNETLNDEELNTLCFDFFPEVFERFSSGMTKGQKIILLIEYCQRREAMADLLAALQKVRPEQYERFLPAGRCVHPWLKREPHRLHLFGKRVR